MTLLWVALVFVVLVVLSMPIVFALGLAGLFGLWHGGYPMQQIASALVSGSQSWVLLAIPAFVFAGGLMERCGMSHALVEFARALVGWVRGGLGMSVIVVAYFFSDICGSKMAEVSALGSSLMPPLTTAGYKKEDSASLIAAGTAMGMLVPPAIFMIVIAQVTNTSPVALFIGGFIPAATIMVCLMVLVYFRARKYDWPVDTAPSVALIAKTGRNAAVPLVIPVVIFGGFFLGAFTATEAGAVVAGYAFIAARFYYRNVSWSQMGRLAYDSAVLTAAVVFLLAVASVFQYLMGVSGVALAAYVGSGTTAAGSGYELDVIASCILGGCSPLGGEGTVFGATLVFALLSAVYWCLIASDRYVSEAHIIIERTNIDHRIYHSAIVGVFA